MCVCSFRRLFRWSFIRSRKQRSSRMSRNGRMRLRSWPCLTYRCPARTFGIEAIHKPDPELWHFGLHQQRDIAEMLVAGHEYAYISDFCRKRLAAPIADEDFAVYGRAYAAPGGLRAGFELYRALSGGRATLPGIHELRFATAPDVSSPVGRWERRSARAKRNHNMPGLARCRSLAGRATRLQHGISN